MQKTNYEGVPQDPQIVRQPGADHNQQIQERWMSIPIGIPNCPPGLEYLTAIDNILIAKKYDSIFGKRTFKIKNSSGENVYIGFENVDCLGRMLTPGLRSSELQILDNFQNDVMHLYRPFKCLIPCCVETIEVSSPPGSLIGIVEQECSFIRPRYIIKNGIGDVLLRIHGPMFTFNCCRNAKFEIFNIVGDKIGFISRERDDPNINLRGFDQFYVHFPLDLEVRLKATIVAATFLLM